MRKTYQVCRWAILGFLLSASSPGVNGEAQVLDSRPFVDIAREEGEPRVLFTGVLEEAERIEGPWRAVAEAESPFSPVVSGPPRFYRAAPLGTNSLFSSTNLVSIGLSGPLQAHFDLALAGTPDGFFPPTRLKPYFDGTLVLPGWTIPVSVRVRGNSSLQECPFPKLKFKVSPEHRRGTPLADAREVKIGTHCAGGGRGSIGRLRDQTAAFREVSAYEAMDALGFIAPRVRRAEVDYLDTTPPTNATTVVGWQLTREALLVEDPEVLAARWGGRPLTEAETTGLTAAAFDPQLTADLQFFHALIGNWDYSLGFDGRGVWNTEVLELPNGATNRLVPLAGDFDLASWVTGIVRRSAPRDYHPELGDLEREARYRLEETQRRVAPERFVAARQRFVAQRQRLEALVERTRTDPEGRTNALRHLTAFYDALAGIQ